MTYRRGGEAAPEHRLPLAGKRGASNSLSVRSASPGGDGWEGVAVRPLRGKRTPPSVARRRTSPCGSRLSGPSGLRHARRNLPRVDEGSRSPGRRPWRGPPAALAPLTLGRAGADRRWSLVEPCLLRCGEDLLPTPRWGDLITPELRLMPSCSEGETIGPWDPSPNPCRGTEAGQTGGKPPHVW